LGGSFSYRSHLNLFPPQHGAQVLIDEKLQIKVSDYGLSRDVAEDRNYYRMATERPMPLRWIAPEAITRLRFSSSTDAYSFGVLVFEVFSFGGFPFETMADAPFLRFLSDGNKAAAPNDQLHAPLLQQLTKVLKLHGVPVVPPLVERLLAGCVVGEDVKRLTFEEIARQTSRAAAAAVVDVVNSAAALTTDPEAVKTAGTEKVAADAKAAADAHAAAAAEQAANAEQTTAAKLVTQHVQAAAEMAPPRVTVATAATTGQVPLPGFTETSM
jgi:serine/threonine protein kinase